MSSTSEPGVMECGDPVVDIVSSPIHLGIFELTRRHRRGATIAELEATSGLGQTSVIAAVDALIVAGLLERIPARGRQSTRYKARCVGITILADHRSAADVSQVRRHFHRATGPMAASLDRGTALDRPMLRGEQRIDARVPLDLSTEEMFELKRLVRGITDFLDNLRLSRRLDGKEGDALCRHVLDLRVGPADPPVLPLPGIRVTSREIYLKQEASEDDRASALSSREREVATLVAQGVRRREIARRLDVSVNTVATLVQRAYRKLGVSDRRSLRERLSRTPLLGA